MNNIKSIKIDIDERGTGSVSMDGVDITQGIVGLTVNAAPGQVTNVVIAFAADVEVTGMAHLVAEPKPFDVALAFSKFLDSLDPMQLEAAALQSLGWGEADNMTRATLDAIAEKVAERADQLGNSNPTPRAGDVGHSPDIQGIIPRV